jgi:hypothetical protein
VESEGSPEGQSVEEMRRRNEGTASTPGNDRELAGHMRQELHALRPKVGQHRSWVEAQDRVVPVALGDNRAVVGRAEEHAAAAGKALDHGG